MSEKKLKAKLSKAAKPATETASSIMESAQQIWLAGLGAFAKAQSEGAKLFDALVREGQALEDKTRKLTSSKVEEVRGSVESAVGSVSKRATDTWDKLEKVFEDRVSRALNALGVPGREEIRELAAKVDALNEAVRKLEAGDASTAPKKTPARKPAAAKSESAPARKAPARAAKKADQTEAAAAGGDGSAQG